MSTETIAPVSGTIAKLRKDVERISLESEGVFIADAYTCESVGDFFKDIGHSISGWFTEKDDVIGDLRPNPSTMSLLDGFTTRKLETIVLPTPIGFKGQAKEYLKVLNAQREALIDNFEENVIDPLETLLGVYVNRPSLLAEMKLADVTRKFKFCDTGKQFTERARFSNGKNTDAALFLSLYVSSADYEKMGKDLNLIARDIGEIKVDKLRKRIEGLEDKINVLIDYIANKDNPYKLTGKVANDLSKLVLTVAEQAESYAVLRNTITEFCVSYRHSFAAIAKQA